MVEVEGKEKELLTRNLSLHFKLAEKLGFESMRLIQKKLLKGEVTRIIEKYNQGDTV
ncbi:hypothetical protein [Orenia metallireducens]|uniref:hypothetical protein n=1 Tax=Orenia metallireducens TaxID=1413210 RepID=UPI001552055D|nr:hypothetical protein [Orenia metallireducens]